MKIIRNIINLPKSFSGCVLTVGNFDGVHLGHKALLTYVCKIAKYHHLPSVVMLFEPQPFEHFYPMRAPARLTSFQEKYQKIKKIGPDYLLCIPFSKHVAHLTAEQFIQEWLLTCLKAKRLVIGEDFTFGANRRGNLDLLAQYAKNGAFALDIMPPYKQGSHRISSTAVRQALAAEKFVLTKQLLGSPYAICGKVVHGNALGRKLGFPTANIHLHRLKAALNGVYLVNVEDKRIKAQYRGIANIGYRPTLNGRKPILEVNIFDFDDDIYEHHLRVTFLKKIREEKKFASLDELKTQIAEDVCIAKGISAQF